MKKPTLCISSSVETYSMARELGRLLEADAGIVYWSQGAFQPGKTMRESLEEVADRSDFAVFIPPADEDWSDSSKFNMLFELGLFVGRLGLSRTFIVISGPETVRMPSDLLGAIYIRLSTANFNPPAIAPAAEAIRRTITKLGARQDRRSTDYYSCFISYSWKDQEFATRLHDDLEEAGVQSWLDAKQIKFGERWREVIDKAVQAHDKVLLILSKDSVSSRWVQVEVSKALQLEQGRGNTVLFPLRLDDAIFDVPGTDEIMRLKERQIGDFSHWQDKRLYQRAFSQLMRALAISASVESGRRF
jgi:hypothetical protein